MRRVFFAVLASVSLACSIASAQTAQEHAVIFEENLTTQGARYEGTTTWGLKDVPSGPGEAAQQAVQAVVTVPDKQLTATWTLRRNTDRALPASHVIEIAFKVPPGSSGETLDDLPGMLMKPLEMSEGTALAGVGVKVTDNYFLFGLNAGSVDAKRNIELLKSLDWIDVPLVRRNGHRLILALQKGETGSHAFDTAFAAWNDSAKAK